MKILHWTLIIISSTAMLSYGQKIDFSRKSVQEVIAIEVNSMLIDTVNFGILKTPHNDIETILPTKALIFKRTDDEFSPQLHVWYFFDKQLSKPKGILYNWGLFNPSFNPSENRELLESFTKREKEFVEKYKTIRKLLIDLLGEPSNSKTIADNKSKLIEQIFWVNDNMIVGLSLEFQREITEIPGIGILGDFQIEIMTTYR